MAATDTLRAEYEALTERCGLVDRSERGKLALTWLRGGRSSSTGR